LGVLRVKLKQRSDMLQCDKSIKKYGKQIYLFFLEKEEVKKYISVYHIIHDFGNFRASGPSFHQITRQSGNIFQ